MATGAALLALLPALLLLLHATALVPIVWEERTVTGWHPEAGRGFSAPLDTMWMSRREVGESPAVVLENGVPLVCANTPAEIIAEKGDGRFLIADGLVYLSASDNTDPRTNGRSYVIRWPSRPGIIAPLALLAAVCGLIWLLYLWRAEIASAALAPSLGWCLLLVIVPFALHRAWFFLDVPLPDVQYDTMSYYATARDVMTGRWPHFEVRPPGYPIALAAVLTATRSLLSVTVLQSLATLGSALLVVYAAYRVQRSIAMWVAVAMAIHVTGFWTLQFDTAILSESLYTSALLASVGFLLSAFASRRWTMFAATSSAMAVAVLIRPAGLFLIVIVAVTMVYLAWNRRGWWQFLAAGLPFAALILAASVYNHWMASAFAPTAWGEANLLGVTSRMWQQDQAYPPEINHAISQIQQIVGMSADEHATVATTWSPARLAPIFLKGYSEPAFAVARSMGGDYVGSRPWMRRISLDAIRRRPDVYAKFVSTMSYLFFVDNIRWRADFADYIKVRALHILTAAAEAERRLRPDEDEMIATYLDRRRISGVGVNDPCIGPDAVGRLSATTALRIHRLTQRTRDLITARTLWFAGYLAVMAAALFQLLRLRGRNDAAFLLIVVGLLPLGAGAVVCLVEYGAPRYSYPTEFTYYLVMAMSPLLFTHTVGAGRKAPSGLLRVLMVTGAYHPEISSSGVQCRDMARLLAGRVDVEVLTTAVDLALPRHDEIDGVPVTRIRVNVDSALSKLRAFRRMVVELVRLVPDADIVHLHGFSTKNVLTTVVARIFRRPVVMSLHTSGFDEPAVIDRHGRLARWAFRSADLYLSVSRGLVETYLAAGMPPDRILEIPNGIDLVRFAPVSANERLALRRQLAVPEGRPVIAFVGFFSRDKQPRVLFDAWLATQEGGGPATTLVFVGATRSAYFEVDDDLAGRMRDDAAARGFGDRVVFAGTTHRVQDYLRAADLFVLPSKREGLPVALLEAMSCGLPCIASRLPGSTDTILEDGVNGVLVPTGDASALADALASLLRDPDRAAAMGAAARDTIERRFANVEIADRWLDAYDLFPTTPTHS